MCVMAHMQKCGHHPIVLLGGGTAMIADPSGKTELRKLLSVEELDNNVAGNKWSGWFASTEKTVLLS